MYMVGTYYSGYNFHFLVFAQDSDNVPYEKVVNWLKYFCSSDKHRRLQHTGHLSTRQGI